MDFEGMNALVTGAAGTVGSAVVRRLVKECVRVRALVHRSPIPADTEGDIDVVHADLADREAVANAVGNADLVVHCGAAMGPDLEACRRANIEGTSNVTEAALAAKCALLVHISTASVYDDRFGLRFSEESPLGATHDDAYGYSKLEAERIVSSAAERGLHITILRPVVVLSMHPTSFWGPLALERARATNMPIFPAAEVPYVHAANLAEAVLLAVRNKAADGQAYNVIDGHGDAASYIGAVCAAIGAVAPDPRPDAPSVFFSGEKIRRELGYSPADRWQDFLGELRNGAAPALAS
jgi:nucleoside-diphosphate-sugar epimerase